MFGLQAKAQNVFDQLPDDTNSIVFPFAFEYNNVSIEQTQVRYGVMAASSPYTLDQMMLVHDGYEKIPAAFRLVPNNSSFPIWNFRYWPEEELFTWVEYRKDNLTNPNLAYICDRQFVVIDSFAISNPHELYVMPDELGYAYIGSADSGGISYPSIVWLSRTKDTLLNWRSADPIWNISPADHNPTSCQYTSLDTIDNIADYYHPNSLAAIKTGPSSLKIGIYNRNIDTEFELTVKLIGSDWVLTSVKDNSKVDHAGHQSDDSVWVNTAHDLQYIFTDGNNIVKSMFDNGGCRANPRTGYKVFTQHLNDSIVTLRKGLYDLLGESSAMGNGGVLLANRYASSIGEIKNALTYGNSGAPHSNYRNSTNKYLLGVWDNSNTLVYGIKQEFTFSTYRFYPYFDYQLPFDDLRPYLTIKYATDSSTVTLSLDSTQYTDVLWIDGVAGTWSRTLSLQEFRTKELVAFVTNNPDWFWFSSHRYDNGKNRYVVGIDEAKLEVDRLSVYPNPVNSGSNINFSTKVNSTLTDLAGKIITSCTVCNKMLIPDGTAPGLYLLNINNGQTALITKILIY